MFFSQISGPTIRLHIHILTYPLMALNLDVTLTRTLQGTHAVLHKMDSLVSVGQDRCRGGCQFRRYVCGQTGPGLVCDLIPSFFFLFLVLFSLGIGVSFLLFPSYSARLVLWSTQWHGFPSILSFLSCSSDPCPSP